MSHLSLRDNFQNFAQALAIDIRHSSDRQSVHYMDLKSPQQEEGYVRMSIDSEDHVLIVEVATPLSCVFPHADPELRDLLTLCLMASPCQSGKRLFPMLDMGSEHLLLSCVVGSEAIRNSADIGAIAATCVHQVKTMLAELKQMSEVKRDPGQEFRAFQSRMKTLEPPASDTPAKE